MNKKEEGRRVEVERYRRLDGILEIEMKIEGEREEEERGISCLFSMALRFHL